MLFFVPDSFSLQMLMPPTDRLDGLGSPDLFYRRDSLLVNSHPVNLLKIHYGSYCMCVDVFGVGIGSFRNSLHAVTCLLYFICIFPMHST